MDETTVGECMTPLVDVMALAEDATVAEGIEVVLRDGYSRVPVYRERIDNLVGRIEHRDLLFSKAAGRCRHRVAWPRWCGPCAFVPESKRVDTLLREMRGSARSVRGRGGRIRRLGR